MHLVVVYLHMTNQMAPCVPQNYITASVLMVLFLAAASEGSNGRELRLYPFGQDEGDQQLDGVSSPAIMLRTSFVFFHQNQTTVFVSLVNV